MCADAIVRGSHTIPWAEAVSEASMQLILESVKKLEELFIAPTARQILHETVQRACARCECA